MRKILTALLVLLAAGAAVYFSQKTPSWSDADKDGISEFPKVTK